MDSVGPNNSQNIGISFSRKINQTMPWQMGAEMYLVSLPQAVNNVLCVIDSHHHFVKPEKKHYLQLV